MIDRPTPDEYAPFYRSYIERVPNGDIVQILTMQLTETLSFLHGVSKERSAYRYAEGKWSLKEVVGHLIDAERIFAYRALRIGRGDETALAGYDENAYMQTARFDERSYSNLVEELSAVRKSNLFLYQSFNKSEWQRRGIANDHQVSVRALAYISAGHELHHLHILQTRYLNDYKEV